MKLHKIFFALLLGLFCFCLASDTQAQTPAKTGFFIRFKVTAPTSGEKFQVNIGGFLHNGEPWVLPNLPVAADKEKWTEWINLSEWQWHGRMNRAGGIAEWNSLKLNILGTSAPSSFAVELSDTPNPAKSLISFTEQSESNTIGFLAPYPLRENAKEFETGSQMTARHAKWANEATNGKPVVLKKFDLITQLWGHYDPSLERQEISNLRLLGFNVLGDIRPENARKSATRVYGHSNNYSADPDYVAADWKNVIANRDSTSEDGKWRYQTMPHWVISDEVSGVDFRSLDPAKVNGWFREYLKSNGVNATDLGKPIESVEFPAKMMFEAFLPKTETLQNRKILYYAAKFNQWWSAQRLRQASDLIHSTFPNVKSETLLPSHGFLGNAWGPANVGMSYRMLDIFELGAQESLNQISAEDWMGLNHMYWADYTWTGGQTFGYFNALVRSGIGDKPIMQRGLITVSDNDYLQLKAYSSLGQGAKSFFFWTFGPTYIGTENYWSDLKSEYDGIARLGRTLEKSEDIISEAKPVTDQVAIIYSVSHDIWNTDNHTAFVEKRLLWHALKHLQIQPDFVREEDVIAGKLAKYKAVYLTDWLVSRKASDAIDKWVKAGGVLYLSAGAATRDEFSEPYSPPFAEAVWGKNAAQNFVSEKHAYNERTDLPKIKPLTSVKLNVNQKSFDLPAIGARLNLAPNPISFATFADGKTAGAELAYGQGKIIAVGFMPMLAYGASAEFKPTTLEEKWKPEPREIIKKVLDAAKIAPAIESNVPVVEADLLAGENGSAVVLANYTYQPIETLTIDIKMTKAFKQATSTEGSRVQMSKLPDGRIRLTLPLKWTDIVLLK